MRVHGAMTGSGGAATAGALPTELDVLLVSHGFQTNYERGFANGLAAHGLAPTLVGSDRSDAAGLSPRVRLLNLRGSQDEARPRAQKALNLLRYHLRLMAHVLTHRRATVHMIGLIEPAWLHGIAEGLLFRLAAARYVLTVHDVLPHDRHTTWNQRLSRWTFRLADRLVVHTPVMREKLVRGYGVDPARIVVMEHGIEPLDALPAPVRPPAAAATARPQLVFFGIVKEYKGLDLLLDALAAAPLDVDLRIVGACLDAPLVADLEARIARHPRREHIRWRNAYVGEAEVTELFGSADALVLPYRHIDQSGVLFQALRHGVPIVATDVGAFAHYVTPELGELCPPEDVPALAAAIGRLVARLPQVDRQRIRDRARHYEWPTTVKALAAAYR